MTLKAVPVQDKVKEIEQKAQALKKSGRVYTPKSPEARLEQYEKDEALRQGVLAAKIPFISPDTGLSIYPGLVLVGGISGKGKSTLLANLIAGYIHVTDRPGIIITNEDAPGAIYNRVACINHNVAYNKFYNNQLAPRMMEEVRKRAREITTQIEIVEDPAYDMSTMEDVQAVLEHAAKGGVGFVGLDYWQTINQSRMQEDAESFRVLKKLGFWLKDYARRVAVPVVNLVQLRTEGKDQDDFKDRVESDRTIFNHAFQCIEVVPDFDNRTTKFKIVKDRYGAMQGQDITMRYENGVFVMEGGL